MLRPAMAAVLLDRSTRSSVVPSRAFLCSDRLAVAGLPGFRMRSGRRLESPRGGQHRCPYGSVQAASAMPTSDGMLGQAGFNPPLACDRMASGFPQKCTADSALLWGTKMLASRHCAQSQTEPRALGLLRCCECPTLLRIRLGLHKHSAKQNLNSRMALAAAGICDRQSP